MEQIHPTRMELIKKRSQIVLAEQGRDLLKQKMEVLIQEFIRTVETLTESRQDLETVSASAERSLLIAKAVDDPVTIRSASFATKRELTVDISGRNIMGVPVPVIQKMSVVLNVMQRGYSIIGTSGRISETAEKYESAIDLIIRLAETETTIKRLQDEVLLNRRRVNALDQVIIPELKQQVKHIRFSIEEREREYFYRLKKVKKHLERKKKIEKIYSPD